MKPNMHPELHTVKVHCQCGSEWETRSTKKELRVEICSVCHPFWTGKQKMMDTAGRVEKFNRKYGPKAAAAVETPVEATETTEAPTEN